MNTIYNLIGSKTETWIKLEKENSQSIINDLITHIEKKDKLRPPQKEAIETYLWVKFVGLNKKLSEIVKEGLLFDDVSAWEYDYYHTFKDNYVTQFLNQFFQDNELRNLNKKLVNDPDGKQLNWENILEELLHNFDYTNYLFSLPMGAGKTYLMASFIYLDLYFASLFKDDKRFAHNFVVFAPQATKTAILPSLRTIKDFHPEWILPKNEAERLKQAITIEILDSLSSKRKDKLHGNNPNLEKVNRLKQTNNFGLVFITNAEKVVLEKYDDKNKVFVKDLKQGQYLLDNRELEDIQKTNELREALSQIPNLTVILDEVHHTYGSIGNGEKKLRQAITVLNQHDNINTVLGLSGTPYVKSKIEIDEKETIKLNQIQDIVYNYPLNVGIGKFLKIPDIRKSSIKETAFVKQALTDFFNDYDKRYYNNTRSKIAFYCPSIEKLNEDILPLVKEWYAENRKDKEEEIFRYYSNVDKKNKEYALPKESLAIFNNLDKPYSKKRVVLLVAIGTEGWDCKSLTAVVLPRQKTTKNFVLQTTCRCLREVDNAENEKALIYLSEDNYETLDKELKENYKLSISDLTGKPDQTIKVQVRKPKLGKIKYKQIETKYKIVKKSSPDTKRELEKFAFSKYKKRFGYDKAIISGKIGKSGLTGELSIKDAQIEVKDEIEYNDLLSMISKYSYGLLSETDLIKVHDKPLASVFRKITKEHGWIYLNPYLEIEDIIRDISACFMDRVEYAKEVMEKETEIELLEWQYSSPEMTFISPNGSVYKFMPQISRRDARTFQRHPEDMLEDYFSADNNIDPQDISFNYIPYKMDSEFEQNALQEMLKLSELSGYEVYFNGYKDDKLQSFWIQTPRGRYTPDFLILKRRGGKKYRKNSRIEIEKVLILETKGRLYYNDEFRSKEKFAKEEFLKNNKHFKYYCFVDEGRNDFRKHLTEFKKILKEF